MYVFVSFQRFLQAQINLASKRVPLHFKKGATAEWPKFGRPSPSQPLSLSMLVSMSNIYSMLSWTGCELLLASVPHSCESDTPSKKPPPLFSQPPCSTTSPDPRPACKAARGWPRTRSHYRIGETSSSIDRSVEM